MFILQISYFLRGQRLIPATVKQHGHNRIMAMKLLT